jgi:hypothetical protein
MPPRMYRYGTELAWLTQDPAGRPKIQVMHEDHVRHHVGELATFTRWMGAAGRPPTKKPAFPPIALAKDVPVFTKDGRLLTEPGHDPTTRPGPMVYLLSWISLMSLPSSEQIVRAHQAEQRSPGVSPEHVRPLARPARTDSTSRTAACATPGAPWPRR